MKRFGRLRIEIRVGKPRNIKEKKEHKEGPPDRQPAPTLRGMSMFFSSANVPERSILVLLAITASSLWIWPRKRAGREAQGS